jgi:hypothetical protein
MFKIKKAVFQSWVLIFLKIKNKSKELMCGSVKIDENCFIENGKNNKNFRKKEG